MRPQKIEEGKHVFLARTIICGLWFNNMQSWMHFMHSTRSTHNAGIMTLISSPHNEEFGER